MKFMGNNIKAAFEYFEVEKDPKNLVVFCDRMDCELGKYMITAGTSFHGHYALRNIAERMGFNDFTCVRIGIGQPNVDEQRTP